MEIAENSIKIKIKNQDNGTKQEPFGNESDDWLGTLLPDDSKHQRCY